MTKRPRPDEKKSRSITIPNIYVDLLEKFKTDGIIKSRSEAIVDAIDIFLENECKALKDFKTILNHEHNCQYPKR